MVVARRRCQPGSMSAPRELPPIRLMTRKPRNRSAKQTALISAATSLFAHRGYEATTTREIAARAGCAEGLIHRYFGGKSGLLFNIVKLHVVQGTARTIQHPASATLKAEIQKLMDWQLDRFWKEREFLCVAFSCGILHPELGKLLSRYMPARAGLVAQRIRSYKECRGSNEDIEVFARTLVSLSFDFGFIRPGILRQNRRETMALAKRAATLLSRGVLAGRR